MVLRRLTDEEQRWELVGEEEAVVFIEYVAETLLGMRTPGAEQFPWEQLLSTY